MSSSIESIFLGSPAGASPFTGAPSGARDDAGSSAIFPGDLGELPLETRRALVQLLLGPSIDAHRQGKLWLVLLRDERVICSRLHELFLELVIDRDQQVAFTRQIVAEDVDVPVLLRKSPLTYLQSALVLFLREQLIQAESRGERAVVSRDDVGVHLDAFRREGTQDEAKFVRQIANALERAKELNLLRKLRGEDERYEVSPALKLLFPVEEILALHDAYARVGAESAKAVEDEDTDLQATEATA